MNHPTLTRRRFMLFSGGLLAASALPVQAMILPPEPAELAFHNLHTGEKVRRVFWEDGQFITPHLDEINHVLRDHRSNQSTAMDPELLILLHRLQQQLGSQRTIEVISAYRSPATNAKLAARSGGVAKRSLHTLGQAIDIRIPGIPLKELRQAALSLRGGGVGFYPRDNFVHLDVGRVRRWG